MGSTLDSLTHRLIRHGLRRGLVEGSVAWIVIGAAAALITYCVGRIFGAVVN